MQLEKLPRMNTNADWFPIDYILHKRKLYACEGCRVNIAGIRAMPYETKPAKTLELLSMSIAEEESGLFILNPVWKNGPKICKASMLPAFATPKERAEFLGFQGNGPVTVAEFQCEVCDQYHADHVAAPPGWSSASGTNRQTTKGTKEKNLEKKRTEKFWKPACTKCKQTGLKLNWQKICGPCLKLG